MWVSLACQKYFSSIPVSTKSREQHLSLTDEAYGLLKAEILENRMPPGFQALEQDLAQRLNMSRTPVREALIRLQEEGLVEVVPRRGMRVPRGCGVPGPQTKHPRRAAALEGDR